jgi:transposase-like protein
MRNTPQKISLCLDLFFRGISTRKVQEHLKAFYQHNADHSTILRWIVKYSRLISNFTDKLKLTVGSEIQLDEVEYYRRKSHKQKRGVVINYLIDSVDKKTRFMLNSDYVKAREIKVIKQILTNIKDKTDNKIQVITTDGFLLYRKIVKKSFGWNNQERKYNVRHNVVNASAGEGFNYPIERLHNTIRARTKTFRGFHGSIESANAILKGLSIYYNFITKHQAINCCPYELAVPEFKLESNNKWLELIVLSSLKENKINLSN